MKRYTVVGKSMQPTIHAGDVVIISDDCLSKDDINIGDVVAIAFNGSKTPMIKRVKAIPGDAIDPKQYPIQSILGRQLKAYQYTLPKHQFIVDGDNLSSSIDSQHFGLVSKSQIIGCLKQVIKKQQQ